MTTEQPVGPAAAAAAGGDLEPAPGPHYASAPAAAAAAGGGTRDYGGAAASLRVPACRAGTAEFAAAKAEVDALLQTYRARRAALDAAGQLKSDMVAWKEFRQEHPLARRPPSYGHIPGVAVGDEFTCRGELAVLTLHKQLMKGVDSVGSTVGAYAIAMSGGYKDDFDDGATFWYTGVGGQGQNKKQERDQEYSHHDNAALVANHDSGTPVRVFRQRTQQKAGRAKASKDAAGSASGGGGGEGAAPYVFEGLYSVVAHRRVPSQDGPMVCQFKLEAVPGHSVVSARVQFVPGSGCNRSSSSSSRRRLRLKQLLLAGASAAAGGGGAAAGGVVSGGGGSGSAGSRPAKARQRAQPSYSFDCAVPTREAVANHILQRAASGTAGRLVCADLSGGLEQVPIPVWNDVDSDDTIPVGVADDDADDPAAMQGQEGPGAAAAAAAAAGDEDADEQFTYLAEYTFGEEEAKSLAIRAEQHFRSHFPNLCGVQYHRGHSCYTVDGRLANIESCGVMECDPDCTGLGDADDSGMCKGNTVLHKGIRYPLEVFKLPGKGWGVRCAVDLAVGAVLCAYVGTVITDSTAELLRGCDRYLFNLDHFTDLLDAQQQQQQQPRGEQQQQRLPPPPPRQQHAQQQQPRGEQQQQRLPPPPPRQQQQQQQQQGRQQQHMPQPMPPPPPQQQQQQQQQAQQQPKLVSGSLSRSLSAAAASGGSLPGRKRQKQQQQQSGVVGGRGEADGLDEGDGPVGCSNPNLPPLHPDMRDTHLVVDASHEGNVARFFNHSCDPNCVVQPVLAKNARSHLLYYNAIVAQEDIPAFTELTYNYNYQNDQQPDETAGADAAGKGGSSVRRVPCLCGATACCKWLLVS